MDEKLLKKVHETLTSLYVHNMEVPVSISRICRLRLRHKGKTLNRKEIKDAIHELWHRGMANGDVYPGEHEMRYVPILPLTFSEKVVEVVRDGFRAAQFFDHIPTENEILDVLNDKFRYMVGIYMKTEMLTHDGAIARQLVERLHLEYFVIHPGVPVRVSFLLASDKTAVIRSTLAERKKMLADLAAKGFLVRDGNKVVPITPYPAWRVYHRNNP